MEHASHIRPIAWEADRPEAEVEVVRLAEIAPHVPRGSFERLDFHAFVLYLRGRTTHEIDFQLYPCRPGTLVHVAPGQVHRWSLGPSVDGLALLFLPSFLFPGRTRPGAAWHERFFEDVAWPSALELAGDDLVATGDAITRIAAVEAESDGSPLVTALLRHLVSAALLDVARRRGLASAPADVDPTERSRAQRFREDVERSFRVTRNVQDHAERLGCSPKTLDRTARAAFGTSAKAFIDARVVLEARRLLAHTTLGIGEIAEELGFTEATNFVKFFKARTGELPGAFRAARAPVTRPAGTVGA